jgi:hypothetical protein
LPLVTTTWYYGSIFIEIKPHGESLELIGVHVDRNESDFVILTIKCSVIKSTTKAPVAILMNYSSGTCRPSCLKGYPIRLSAIHTTVHVCKHCLLVINDFSVRPFLPSVCIWVVNVICCRSPGSFLWAVGLSKGRA